ncbi:MAG: ATP-binding cassette domain-containing protein [Defluviitaleaceae bacterium]|nr:ATP-binding cassette domain-containing protein [Defluviitaleaceae bacterium]
MLLSVTNLNKSYGSKHVLKDVSFEVKSGRTLGLLGRNGHGKSTTMKIIMGIIYSNSGEVTVDGVPIEKSGLKLGYLPEERGLYQKIKVIDQMIYFGKLRGLTSTQAKTKATDFLEKLEMTEYTQQKANTLSKGNQQKIQLAIAMLNEPDIIILDEPYSGLDPVNSRLLQNIIEESAAQNKTILFSSHQLNTVEEFCRDICIINHGEVLLNGNLRDIKNTYPKNKLLIVPETGKETQLVQIAKTLKDEGYCENYKNTEQGLIVTIKDEGTKNTILNKILSQTEINSFSIVEPALLEIFLEKVGETAE